MWVPCLQKQAAPFLHYKATQLYGFVSRGGNICASRKHDRHRGVQVIFPLPWYLRWMLEHRGSKGEAHERRDEYERKCALYCYSIHFFCLISLFHPGFLCFSVEKSYIIIHFSFSYNFLACCSPIGSKMWVIKSFDWMLGSQSIVKHCTAYCIIYYQIIDYPTVQLPKKLNGRSLSPSIQPTKVYMPTQILCTQPKGQLEDIRPRQFLCQEREIKSCVSRL